jgi:phosphoribosyl 1,2-cyclic phosphodiesterase
MELQVLGTGSAGNCYVLQNDKEALVLEAGVSHKRLLNAINYDTTKVKGLLVSHLHGDHARYLRQYQWTLYGDTYGHSNILDAYAGFTYQSIDVEHDAANQAFIIEHPDIGSLFYLSDACYIPAKVNGLNHLLVEANYSEPILEQNVERGLMHRRLAQRIKDNHLSIEALEHWLRLVDISQLQSVTLCHLSDKNSDKYEFKNRIQQLTGVYCSVAQEGFTYLL